MDRSPRKGCYVLSAFAGMNAEENESSGWRREEKGKGSKLLTYMRKPTVQVSPPREPGHSRPDTAQKQDSRCLASSLL